MRISFPPGSRHETAYPISTCGSVPHLKLGGAAPVAEGMLQWSSDLPRTGRRFLPCGRTDVRFRRRGRRKRFTFRTFGWQSMLLTYSIFTIFHPHLLWSPVSIAIQRSNWLFVEGAIRSYLTPPFGGQTQDAQVCKEVFAFD